MAASKKPINQVGLVGGLANNKSRAETARDSGVSESTPKRRMKEQGTTFSEKRSKLNPFGRKGGK